MAPTRSPTTTTWPGVVAPMAVAASVRTSRSVASTATRLSACRSGKRASASNEKVFLTEVARSVRWAHICLGRHFILPHQADRAGHPVGAVVAVATGVLVEVLLVIALGVVEGAGILGGAYLGGDVAEAVAVQHGLKSCSRRTRRRLLAGGRPVDGAAVLGAEVVSLAEALRRVVIL